MNKISRNIYITFALMLILNLVLLNLQFVDAKRHVSAEVKKNAKLSSELVKEQIEAWIAIKASVIIDISQFVEYNPKDDLAILDFMSNKLSNQSDFASLYYLDTDNKMVNASGFVPPAEIDFRTRVWYIKATSEGRLVFTDPFLNASRDAYIVVIAVPVISSQGELLGVVGGDIKLDTLATLVGDYNSLTGSRMYLADSNLNSITGGSTIEFEDIVSWYNDNLGKGGFYFEEGIQQGNTGYYTYLKLEDSGWTLLGFSYRVEISQTLKKLELYSYALLGVGIIVFIIIVVLQRRYVLRPLLAFEGGIEQIDIARDEDYRLDLTALRYLSPLGLKINELLDKISTYLDKLREDKDELLALNEELEASFEQLVATESEVSRQKKIFEALFKNSEDAIAMFDQNRRIVDINDRYTDLFGYSLGEVLGRDISILSKGESQLSEVYTFAQRISNGETISMTSARVSKSEAEVDVEIRGVPIMYEGNFVGGYVLYTDIRERIVRERYLEYISSHDSLTGLHNRLYYEAELGKIDKEENYPISVILADLNGLKLINDAFGHKVGDDVIKRFAKVLSDTTSPGDILARLGGDEFALVLPRTSGDIAERYVKDIKERCRLSVEDGIELSVSLGWADKKDSSVTLLETVRVAEDYMYRHKLMDSPGLRGSTVYTIVNALHEKSKREEQHSKRVSELSYLLGQKLNLSDRDLSELRTMGLMHDIGKISIDYNILDKASKLTDEEYEEIKKHPEIGYRILSSVNELAEMAVHVLSHHERIDGKGYPRGLKGEEIPFLSRIIAVVDAYDAMTSDRPYRKAMTKESALEEIKRFINIQFDEQIAEAFIEMIEEQDDSIF